MTQVDVKASVPQNNLKYKGGTNTYIYKHKCLAASRAAAELQHLLRNRGLLGGISLFLMQCDSLRINNEIINNK